MQPFSARRPSTIVSVRETVSHRPESRPAVPVEPWRRRFVPAPLRRDRVAGQVVRFGLVGVLNTLVDFGTFNLLAYVVGVPVLIAYPISVAAGIVNSFVWNKHWTFSAGDTGRWSREAAVFVAVSIGGLLINYAGFVVLHFLIGDTSQLVVNLEKLAASIVSMVWNFLGYRFFAFRAHRRESCA